VEKSITIQVLKYGELKMGLSQQAGNS